MYRHRSTLAETHRRIATLAAAAALAGAAEAPAATPCQDSATTAVPQPTAALLDAAGLGRLPLAPAARRVDLVAPPFSNSTSITNPLFPISSLRRRSSTAAPTARLKIETTLLPDTRVIEWRPGQCVRTLVSQFVAYRGGRILEVALDFYAQADDGSVWYFGEDVFNYRRGGQRHRRQLARRKEGPAAMIMPAQPGPGMVYRPENVPGLVFEEVTVKRSGVTVQGPRGPVAGAMVAGELHDDGTREDKYFAPGYGEFRSAGDSDLARARLPADALRARRLPSSRRSSATPVLRGSGRQDARRWRALQRRGVPRRLAAR